MLRPGARWRISVSGVLAGVLGAAAGLSAVLTAPQPPAQAAAPAPCTTEAPDDKAAAAMAARCAANVEVLAERTESSQVFVQPGGARKLVASTAPQRVRRVDGSWAPISTRLARGADGLLRPEATLADVAFSGGGSAPLVTWREGGATFTLSWPLGELPTPRIDGAGAVYEQVLPDVNLHVTATEQGYTHAVELLSAKAAANPAVRSLAYLTGGDAKIKHDADGTLRLGDSDGRTFAVSHAASMWDSSADPGIAGQVLATAASGDRARAAEPAVTSRTAKVQVDLAAGGFTVRPDAKLLADPKLTYPVFIDPEFEKTRSKWSYANTINSNWDVNDRAWVGRNPFDGTLYRSFFDFPVSGLKGKKILSATARFRLDHSWSCSPTRVSAFRTGAITVTSGRMPWSARPLPSSVYLDWADANANDAGGCGTIQPDTDVEFDHANLKNDLQIFADSSWSTYTIGLCACLYDGTGEENQDRWKKFYQGGTNTTPTLEVTYDSVPATPSSLTTSGQSCGATIGTTSPVFKAYYGDADAAADSLTGYFEYQQTAPTVGTVIAKTGQTKPGNAYGDSGTISLGSAAEGKTYQWRVKTKDAAGFESSPVWSPWCSFTVNAAVPTAPKVSSTLYKADGLAYGGPGVSSSFKFEPNGAPDVVKYVYGWAGQTQPLTTVNVTAGSTYSVTLTPPRHGYNTLDVYSIDTASKQSLTTHFQFLVGSPSAPVARWPLNDIDGSMYRNSVDPDAPLAVDPAVDSDIVANPDGWLLGVNTPLFDSDSAGARGVATAPGSGLDTSGSFSVAAWVKHPSSALCAAGSNQTAVSLDGAHISGFMISYMCDTGRWRFRVAADDSPTSSLAYVESAPSMPADVWTHLVGVWDEGEQTIALWVDGELAPTSPAKPASTWLATRGEGWPAGGAAATGPLVLGRYKHNDMYGSAYRGEIRDVVAWNRVVTKDDIRGTEASEEQGTQATAGLITAQEVASWDFNGADVCYDTFSATYWSQSLYLSGCTDPASPGQLAGYTGDAHDDNEALWLNSTQPDGNGTAGFGHAYTEQPIVRTDQSVTVSMWVKPDVTQSSDQAVFSLCGEHECALWLKYYKSTGGWRAVAMRDDVSGSTFQSADSTSLVTGQWTHLTVVYDAATSQLRLYVNGGLEKTTTLTFRPFFTSSGILNIGRTKYRDNWVNHLPGTVDQVKVFAGALSDREVKALHTDS